jgi:molybdopterin converting factor small subunit
MTVRVLAFARLREIVGFAERPMELPDGATAHDVWQALIAGSTHLAPLAASTRLACNGTVVDATIVLRDGDELALLPPIGGG